MNKFIKRASAFSLVICMMLSMIPSNAYALDYDTKIITFDENMSDSGTQTITIPNLQSIEGVNVNTGNVSYSVDGDDVTINVEGGNPSRVVDNPKKHSKIATDSLTNNTDSFSSTKSYSDENGYSGSLTKSGSSNVISGSYTPSDSKTVTDTRGSEGSDTTPATVSYNKDGYSGVLNKTNTIPTQVQTGGSAADSKTVTAQTKSAYNDGTYSGTLTSYVYSGSYTPADSKTVMSKTGPQTSTSFSSTKSYSSGGYSGTLSKSGSYYNDGTIRDSKTVSDYLTSSTNSFSSTKSYNSGGYSGTLSKSGSSYVNSGSHTLSDTKYVTAQTSSYYNSGGYTGTLTQYLYSGHYTPADEKEITVEQDSGATISYFCDRSGFWIHSGTETDSYSRSTSFNYNGQIITLKYDYKKENYRDAEDEFRPHVYGYEGQRKVVYVSDYYSITYSKNVEIPAVDTRVYRYQGYVTKPESDTRVWIQNYSGTVYKSTPLYSQNYSGIVTKPAVDTRDYRYQGTVYKPDTRTYRTDYTANYSGTVVKPAVDTRVWKQDYSGTVYKSGIDNYYSYTVTIDYIDNTAPLITVNNPLNNEICSDNDGYNNITLSGTISDTSFDIVNIYYNIDNGIKNLIQTITADGTNQSYNKVVDIGSLSEGNHIVKIWAVDQAEAKSIEIDRTIIIDKTNPDSPILIADITEPTNTDVTVTISYPDDAVVKQYKIGDGEWIDYLGPITIELNNTVFARCQDVAGNWSDEASLEINNIDKEMPVITAMLNNPDELTTSKTVTITASDNNNGYKVILPDNSMKIDEYEITYTLDKNGVFEFKIIDIAGNEALASVDTKGKIETGIFETINVTYDESLDNREGDINVTAESESGIVKIEVSKLISSTINTIETNKIEYKSTEAIYGIKENGTYRITITNGNGTVLTKEIDIVNINDTPTTPMLTVKIDGKDINDKAPMFRMFSLAAMTSNDTQGSEIEIYATPVHDTSISSIKVYKDGRIVGRSVYQDSLEFTTDQPGEYEVIAVNNKSEQAVETFTLEAGTVTFTTDVNVDGQKAIVSVNTLIDGNNSVSEIKIEGNGISESVLDLDNAIFEVTDNGTYQITVTDAFGNPQTQDVIVDGLNSEFYITYTIDNSEVEEGIVAITAKVIGGNDTLTFNDKTVNDDFMTVYVQADGLYRFIATKGENEVYVDVFVDSFSNIPPIKILIDRESLISGVVKTTVTAESLDGSYIKSIKIYKDGVYEKKNSYRSSLSFDATIDSEYLLEVTNSNNDVVTKAFDVFFIETLIDDSTAIDGYISLNAKVTGEIDSLSLGETTTTENTLTVPVSKSGIYKFKAIKGNTIVTATLNIDMSDYAVKKPTVNIETNETLNGVDIVINAIPTQDTVIQSIKLYKDNVLLANNNYKNELLYSTTELGNYKAEVQNNRGEIVIKDFVVEYNPIQIDASYNILGPKAEILVKATSLKDTQITKIELADQVVENLETARFEATENGSYEIKVTDNEGNVKTSTVNISCLNENFYIELISDISTAAEGYVTINANVVGEFNSFMFGDEVLIESPAVVTVNKDGNYTFTAMKDDVTVSADITITAFVNLDTKAKVDVSYTKNGGSYIINVIASPAYPTSIKSITILKDGSPLKKSTYRTNLSYSVSETGTYVIEVMNSKGEITSKELIIE